VAGEVKVGNTALACAAGTEGAMRFNSTSKVMEYCNGTAWTVMQGAACSDSTSNAVVFTNLANQTLSTLVTSDIKQVTGINCSVVTSVSGPGTPAYRICADAACATVDQDWTTGSSSLINGQFVQLRQTTSGSGGVPIAATFTAGSSAIVWTAATTGDCASSPTPGTVCADGTVYVGLSPDGSVPMFTQRCDYGMSWNGSACTGSRIFISWNNGGSNNIATTYTNQTTGEANTSAIVLLANADAPHVAAAYCDGLSENTYGDWYLPSRNELILIYNSYTAIGNFVTSNNYWSSSETTSAQAYGMRFSDGAGTSAGKSVNNLVRCVRR
ncbi:MAG: DUF1566 domain-containing protein, partial [Bdellovibrionota bacterium]